MKSSLLMLYVAVVFAFKRIDVFPGWPLFFLYGMPDRYLLKLGQLLFLSFVSIALLEL